MKECTGPYRVSELSGKSAPAAFVRARELEDKGHDLIHVERWRLLLKGAGVAAIPGAAGGPSGKKFVRFSFARSTA